jgi:eukaryotic-like serine/threonine-protein kinase
MTDMDVGRWQRVEPILDHVLERDPSEWSRLLDEHCGDDVQLRRDVEHYLEFDASTGAFLGLSPLSAAADAIDEVQRKRGVPYAGQQIGAYRIVREIGRGGMSRVYLAERADGQYDQQVALKLLRTGYDSEADDRRLRAERQILASLNHPAIARLLDGGVTDEGRPYLVLEFVDGVRIDRYCDDHALTVDQRLELFLTVAGATQYAHRKLVVHRDLKPSNILVTSGGQVKLLDFGIAKLLADEPGETPLSPPTYSGRRLMTPEYAAPEQIRGDAVTTSTDVYQLGAVLYKLLAARVPLGERRNSVHELESAVLNREPELPSSVCAPELSRALRGDLDAIVLKSLRKEPELRYATADDLAADVRRHLSGEPVLARRQTTGYRARRFAKRHRWALGAAASIAVLLGAYAVTVTVQSARVTRALAQANAERARAEEVTSFTLGLFHADDPRGALQNGEVTRELLDRGLQRARALTGEPLTQARMFDVIGRVQTELGAYANAREVLHEALAIRTRQLGESHPDVAESLMSLAELVYRDGDARTAVTHRRRAHEILRSAYGPTDRRTLAALYSTAAAMHMAGDYVSSRPLLDEWIAAVSAAPRETTADQARRLGSIATILKFRGDPVRAETFAREALEIRRALYGERHPDVANSMRDLASALASNGRLEEAERMLREVLAMVRSFYPDGHEDVGYALSALAQVVSRSGRYDEAEQLLLEDLAILEKLHGNDHIMIGTSNESLGTLNRRRGTYARAEQFAREAHRIYSLMYPDPTNLLRLRTQIDIGEALRAQGKFAPAESLLVSALRALPDRPGEATATRREALQSLVKLHEARGQMEKVASYREILQAVETKAASARK